VCSRRRQEELIRGGDYDIVIPDYKLPLLGGVEVLIRLNADTIRKRIFTITGRPSVEQIVKEENLSDMVSAIIA
jgi:hypothetical protein